MQIKDLIGFQVVSIDDSQMTVRKGDRSYTIDFQCDQGDCCGYADISHALLFNPGNTDENPVITKIEFSDDDDGEHEASVLVTLFGEYKPLAEIKACAGSGSGWTYGAAVTAKCTPLNLDETIVCW